MPDEIIEGQDNVVEENLEEVTASETPAELPEDASERTKEQFEKLKQHNKELAEELERTKNSQPKEPALSVLDSLRPQRGSNSVAQTQPNYGNLVDENGYVDAALLEKRQRDAEDRAFKAENEAREARERIERLEETQESKKVHESFPWLEPGNPKYDPKFFNAVRNEMIGQFVEGKSDFMAAAKKVQSEIYDPKQYEKNTTEEAKKEAIENFKHETAKEQAQMTGSARPSSNNSELVNGTRKGDADAIFARLQASGY